MSSVPRLAAPLRLTDLDDDTLTIALARAPFATHAALRSVCSRARELIDSAAFASSSSPGDDISMRKARLARVVRFCTRPKIFQHSNM